jgi:glycine/D-amino acid oxidase-like deaminating enzyme
MKLRSPEAFWLLKNGILNSYPKLQENTSCDIVLLGAGITGSLISHALHNAGYNVVVIDKRDVANGSSAATTSMLQYEIDVSMIDLADMIGIPGAVECYRAGIESIDTLHDLVKKEKIDCGFDMKESLQVAHSKRAVKSLRKEFEMRKQHGFDVKWLTSEEIEERYKMESHPGILSSKGASIDAFQFAHGLFQNNHKRGMRIYDHTTVDDIKYGEDGVQVKTEDGYTVNAKKIVFCTGFETMQMFKKKYADIVTTFACVSEQDLNLFETLDDTLIWDTASPYIYMRTTDDKRLLVGGEDIKYKYSSISEKVKKGKSTKLVKKLNKLFPEINFIEDYVWAGAFGVTKDGLPFIGKHPDFKNAIFVLGLGGNGITFSVQGMDLVLKVLAGYTDNLLHYYRFDR